MFNYIGTFNKPTAINKTISCSFIEPYPKLNLVLTKTNYIEIYNVNNENLELFLTYDLFGNVLIIEKIIEDKSNKQDNLFILNDSLEYCILNYDRQMNSIKMLKKGEIREGICKIKNEVFYAIDKDYKFVILSPFKNNLRVIFLHSSERDKNEDFKIKINNDEMLYLLHLNKNFPSKEKENFLIEKNLCSDFSFDFRNFEKQLKSNQFNKVLNLFGNRQPFHVIKLNESNISEKKSRIKYYNNLKNSHLKNVYSSELFAMVNINNENYPNNSDSNNSNLSNEKKIITVEPFLIDFTNKELKKVFKISFELESYKDSNFIFSPRIGGVIVFYSDDIEYFEILSNKIQKCTSIIKNNFLQTPFPIFKDYCSIDLYNYILYDADGEMYLFNMTINNKTPNKTSLNEYEFYILPLGSLNYISSMCYISKNNFFLGSDKSNSFYIKINDLSSNLRNVSDILSIENKNNNFNNNFSSQIQINNSKQLADKRTFIDILQEFENLAPISNFLVLNDSKEDNFTDINTEILCVSGVGKYTSFKSIRKGRSFIEDAELPYFPGNKFFSIEVDHISNVNMFNHIFYSNDEHNEMIIDSEIKKSNNNKDLLFFLCSDINYETFYFNRNTNIIKSFNKIEIFKLIPHIPLYINNFVHQNTNYILSVTNKNIIILDLKLNIISNYFLSSDPVTIIFKKKRLNLYIFQNNNIIVKYNIKKLFELKNKNSKDKMEIDFNLDDFQENLINNFSISHFDVSDQFIVFANWMNNKINIYIFESRLIIELNTNKNSEIFITGLMIIKLQKKYIFVSFSDGSLNLYIFKEIDDKMTVGKNQNLCKENFIFKNNYIISNDPFEISKIKLKDINYLFINSESPYIISFLNENLMISNFNHKNCQKIFNIKTFSDYFLSLKKDQILLGSIEENLSKDIISKPLNKQIYNLTYNKKYNLIFFTSDEYLDENNNIQFGNQENKISKFNVMDKNLNEISSYKFDKHNEICHTFEVLDLYNISKKCLLKKKRNKNEFDDEKETEKMKIDDYEDIKNDNEIEHDQKILTPIIFVFGTSIFEKNHEPKSGQIVLVEFNKFFRFNKLIEIDLFSPIYKINCLDDFIFSSIPHTLIAHKIILKLKNTNESLDMNSENFKNRLTNQYYDLTSFSEKFSFELREIRKLNEFYIIYDLICNKDFILVSDVNKSVILYKFNKEKENFIELCKDFNPLFCISLNKTSHNVYTICDYNSNIYKLRIEIYPKEDTEKYKLDKIGAFNIGQKILKQIKIKRKISKFEEEIFYPTKINKELKIFNIFSENAPSNHVNQNYFVTNEGSLGIIVSLSKEVFEYLSIIEKEILKILEENRFNYEKWRSVKDKFIITKPKGFIDGLILQEYLNFDDKFLKGFMKSINYPAKRKIRETKKLIEMFFSYH